MREINECTAEVFRRSEKRIKERRRNRNRILTLCIPLCLMVTVWSVIILSAMLPVNNKSMLVGESIDVMDGADGSSVAFVQVEIGTGAAAQPTILKDDANEVAQIYDILQSIFAVAGEGDEESEDHEESDGNEITDFMQTTNTAVSGYKVIFTAGDGVNTVFLITRDQLINESTNRKVTLTEDQYSKILTALGLTVMWKEET